MNNERKGALQAEITALMEEEEFFAKLVTCQSAEETQKLLAAQGIEITLEEVTEFTALGENALKNQTSDELSEDDLDMVAGGGLFKKIKKAAKKTLAFGGLALGAAAVGFASGVCPPIAPVAVPAYVALTGSVALSMK